MASKRAKLDRLWRIWYALLILAIHGFLLYSSFQRYATFRSRALREQWDMAPMNFHLAASIAAALLLPLFLYTAFLRTGNFAEEDVQIGRDRDSLRSAVAEVAAGRNSGTRAACVGRVWRHFAPVTCCLHLVMALCLLLPMPVLEAAEVAHGLLPSDQVWRTNLDFLFRPAASATNAVSTEIFNLVLALAILLVRYPAVFWFSNRLFSLLFSFVLCACGLHAVLGYEATSVLYKASATDTVAAPVSLAPAAVLALNTVSDLLLLLASVAFFEFGYGQVLGNLRRYRHYLQLEAPPSSGCSDRSGGSGGGGGSSDDPPCWLVYAPQLAGVLLTVMAALCKAPVFWDWVGLYRSNQQPVMLAALISCGVYLLLWLAVWLLFCCRSSWQFNIRLEVEFPPGKLSPPGYHHQSLTRPLTSGAVPERRSPPGSSADSDLSKKSNQYVFMQRPCDVPISMIPTVSEQVDNASENSYTCGGAGGGGGGGGTLDRQAGLGKYQVRRNSAQMSACGSLKRNALLARASKTGNRVTFKERHETIPGSPGSSQNTSSDSGIEASRIPSQQASGSVALQISLNDDYARVNKQPRAPSRQSDFDDYPMLGCLFAQSDVSAAAAAAAEYYQTDPYGRPLPGVPVLPPPPAGYGTAAAAAAAAAANYASDPYGAAAAADYRAHGVPDILLSRSPFASLGRSAAGAKQAPADYYEMQQHHQFQMMQQQQLQEQLMHASSYASLPPSASHQSAPGDQVEVGLCSQV